MTKSIQRHAALDATCSRRSLLKLGGSLTALSWLPACRRPEEYIVPAVNQAEYEVPGRPLHYATALALMGNAFGLLVESHEGRPTKIEGNPKHPENVGKTSSFLQAQVLDLYDSERSCSVIANGQRRDWTAAKAMLIELAKALDKVKGRTLGLLMNDHRSPTVSAQVRALRKKFPEAQVYAYDTFDSSLTAAATALAFGRRLEPIYRYDRARVLVGFDADVLGLHGDALRAARGWASLRDTAEGCGNRWYMIEPSLTVTGGIADHRFLCERTELTSVLCGLTAVLGAEFKIRLPESLSRAARRMAACLDPARWSMALHAMARDLAEHQGRSLIIVGEREPAVAQALAMLLNHALGNQGQTIDFRTPFDDVPSGSVALRELAERLAGGQIKQVLVMGSNAVYDAPGDLSLERLLKQAELSVHLGLYVDETAQACQWHIPQAHPLESWGDVMSRDQVAAIVQPLIAPLFGGKTSIDVMSALLNNDTSAYQAVQSTWQGTQTASSFEAVWRRALRQGVIEYASEKYENPEPRADEVERLLQGMPLAPSGYWIDFVPDAHSYDGRFANNQWLHELPEPIGKATWGNAAKISGHLARKFELADGDVIELKAAGRSVKIPVVISPGQADRTITVTLGQGRKLGGSAARTTGTNLHGLRTMSSPYSINCEGIARAVSHQVLARTQSEFAMHGRAVVKTLVRENPESLHAKVSRGRTKGSSRYAIVIDLAKCTGCGACATACQAENNISCVGASGVREGRHMHWLRLDRYYEGEGDKLLAMTQPVMCQQCENAPCEAVCPAGATAHSPDGLSDMVYNRCVGSRYCANNCPFKSRRFNYFDYWGSVESTRRLQLNPDVTVRSRGVMEKCTFCVQRINQGKADAKQRGLISPEDGTIFTACQQACPTGAIVFGDLAKQSSAVSNAIKSPRAYRLLDELGLGNRVVYLSIIRNLNPEVST